METKNELILLVQPETQKTYEAPVVKAIEVIVERGFAMSADPYGTPPSW